MTQAGNVPTHVLLTQDWQDDREQPSSFEWIHNNRIIVNKIIPWRDLPRDLTLFAFESLRKRSIKKVYSGNQDQVDGVLINRGYYFIKSQSHFENDELPNDFKLASDDAFRRKIRSQPKTSWVFHELIRLQKEYGFIIITIPTYYRIGEYAEPELITDLSPKETENQNILSIELGYVLYPPKFFADPVHLNPRGAEAWTRDIGNWIRTTLPDCGAL